MEGSYKAAKGLIKVKVKVSSGIIMKIQIAGDFFMYPEDMLWDLERSLLGTEISHHEILSKVGVFYDKNDILSPGVTPEDIAEAIIRAVNG